jgi:hypothetical protein
MPSSDSVPSQERDKTDGLIGGDEPTLLGGEKDGAPRTWSKYGGYGDMVGESVGAEGKATVDCGRMIVRSEISQGATVCFC